jgi:hypothetical protein
VPLIQILDWNFNWQDVYHYQDPLALPPAPGSACASSTTTPMRIPETRIGRRGPSVTVSRPTTRWPSCGFQVLTRSEADRVKLVKDLRGKVLQEEIKGRRAMLTRDAANVALRDDCW